MALHELLSKRRPQLTPAQTRTAEYIMTHHEQTVFLTASALARKAGVSEATVVRLAQSLGFDGYPDMQRFLRESIQDRLTTVQRLEKSAERAGSNGNLLQKVIGQDILNLQKTMETVPPEVFQKAVREIRDAKRVYIAGLRGAHGPATTFCLYLRFLEKEAVLLKPGIGALWDSIQDVGAGDLVVGISFPRYTRTTMEILEQARFQGARVGAVTDSPLSPLTRRAHWVLTAECRLDSFIESFTATMSLINALLTALSLDRPKKTIGALEKREALWEAKGTYIAPPKKKLSS